MVRISFIVPESAKKYDLPLIFHILAARQLKQNGQQWVVASWDLLHIPNFIKKLNGLIYV